MFVSTLRAFQHHRKQLALCLSNGRRAWRKLFCSQKDGFTF